MRGLIGRLGAILERNLLEGVKIETLDAKRIEKFRKDFLVLMKNSKVVKDYNQAEKWRSAMRIWTDQFGDYMQLVMEFIGDLPLTHKQIDRSTATAWKKEWGKAYWPVYIDARVPLEWSDDYWSKEARFAQLQQELKRWEASTKRKVQKTWRDLKIQIERIERVSQSKVKVRIPVADQEKIEGFSVKVVGYDPSSKSHAESLSKFRVGLRRYKQRAKKVFPRLLSGQLPLVLDFNAGIDTGGEYRHDHIWIAYHASEKNPGRMTQVLAHEMGHHVYKTILSKADQGLWRNAIYGTRKTLDLQKDVLDRFPREKSLLFSDAIRKADPLLYLQIQGFSEGHYSGGLSNLLSMDDLREYLSRGGEKTVRVMTKPITGYANKNAEESFCEALGMLVGYGPQTVLPEVRAILRHILGNQLRVEDEMPQTLGLRSSDTKKKYAKLPRALRPNKSRYKARSHLMNTTNPNAIGGEQNATPMRECVGRLTCFVEGDRDDGEARIAKRDVKVLGKARKRAKAAGDSGELGPFDRTNTVKLWKRTSIGSAGT